MEQRLSDHRVVVEKNDRPSLNAAGTADDSTSQADAYERMEAYLAKRETLEDEPAVLSSSNDAAETSC